MGKVLASVDEVQEVVEDVLVQVTDGDDIAGQQVYLQVGEDHGVSQGGEVTLDQHLQVLEVRVFSGHKLLEHCQSLDIIIGAPNDVLVLFPCSHRTLHPSNYSLEGACR